MPDLPGEDIEAKIENFFKNEIAPMLEGANITADIPDESAVDMKSLYNEIGSIKTEMKQMNRLENSRIEALQEWLKSEDANREQFLENYKRQNAWVLKIAEEQNNSRNAPLYSGLFEIRDFIERFYLAVPRLPYPESKGLFSKQIDFGPLQNAFKENIGFILKKIDYLLEKEGITIMSCLNRPFDPMTMAAVELVHLEGVDDNMVVEEIEKGYIRLNTVVRYAKVKVNKKTGDTL